MKLKLCAWFQRLKLKHDEPLLIIALHCKLRPYTLREEGVATAAADTAAAAAAASAAASPATAEVVAVATSTAAATAAAASDADPEDEDVGSTGLAADDLRVAADPRLLTRVLVHMRQGLALPCDRSLSTSNSAQLKHLSITCYQVG